MQKDLCKILLKKNYGTKTTNDKDYRRISKEHKLKIQRKDYEGFYKIPKEKNI